MSVKAAVYVTATGQIVQISTAETLAAITASLTAGQAAAVITGAETDVTHYYTGGTVTAKTALSTIATWDDVTILSDGTQQATLSGLPNPSVITVTFPVGLGLDLVPPITVTDGDFELSVEAPGEYTVRAAAFPYLDFVQVITAS